MRPYADRHDAGKKLSLRLAHYKGEKDGIVLGLPRGGVVGSVEIVNCVTASNSRWFSGKYGFVLRDPRPLPFTPWSGLLGFFDVDLSKINGGDTL